MVKSHLLCHPLVVAGGAKPPVHVREGVLLLVPRQHEGPAQVLIGVNGHPLGVGHDGVGRVLLAEGHHGAVAHRNVLVVLELLIGERLFEIGVEVYRGLDDRLRYDQSRVNRLEKEHVRKLHLVHILELCILDELRRRGHESSAEKPRTCMYTMHSCSIKQSPPHGELSRKIDIGRRTA